MRKKFLLAVLSYFVLTMALAYPWHMILFHDVYAEVGAFTREAPVMPLGIMAILIQACVIAHLYPIYYSGGTPVWQGIRFSLLIGLVVYSAMGLATAAKIDIRPISTFLIYHSAFQLLQFVMTGAALGLIYGRLADAARTPQT